MTWIAKPVVTTYTDVYATDPTPGLLDSGQYVVICPAGITSPWSQLVYGGASVPVRQVQTVGNGKITPSDLPVFPQEPIMAVSPASDPFTSPVPPVSLVVLMTTRRWGGPPMDPSLIESHSTVP